MKYYRRQFTIGLYSNESLFLACKCIESYAGMKLTNIFNYYINTATGLVGRLTGPPTFNAKSPTFKTSKWEI